MKNSDGTTITKHQLVYFQDGTVKVWSNLLEGGYCSAREIDLLNTLKALLEVTQNLYDENRALRDENAVLSNRPKRPKLKPSVIAHSDTEYHAKRNKRRMVTNPNKAKLPINQTVTLKLDSIPTGSRFKGYQDFHVQDLEIKTLNTLYRRERWQSPCGKMFVASLPKEIRGGHFGPSIKQFALYQYYHQRVTQPLLLNQLREFGISISAGQLSNLLTKDNHSWHEEKQQILTAGLSQSTYVQVDDTGARHLNKNYFCTQICNETFSFFETKATKSRYSFLEILQGRQKGFSMNEPVSLEYLKTKGQFTFSNNLFLEKACDIGSYSNVDDWNNLLITGYVRESNYRVFTEAAMLGYLALTERINPELIIVSDNAGQFKLGRNAACWVHAERLLTSVIPRDEFVTTWKSKKLYQFWLLYRYIKLKKHKANQFPHITHRAEILFDKLCTPPIKNSPMTKPLKLLYGLKEELLFCLQRPEIPMHNNQCESDIREYVMKRNISGSTRSFDGLRSRDTFLSLKKTSAKHGVSFWDFLGDRLTSTNQISSLASLITDSK